jgi:hypothetical protein
MPEVLTDNAKLQPRLMERKASSPLSCVGESAVAALRMSPIGLPSVHSGWPVARAAGPNRQRAQSTPWRWSYRRRGVDRGYAEMRPGTSGLQTVDRAAPTSSSGPALGSSSPSATRPVDPQARSGKRAHRARCLAQPPADSDRGVQSTSSRDPGAIQAAAQSSIPPSQPPRHQPTLLPTCPEVQMRKYPADADRESSATCAPGQRPSHSCTSPPQART